MVAPGRQVRAAHVAVIVCLVALVAACGGGAERRTVGGDPTGGASDESVATYGYGPSPAPGVTYQDDVVMVGAGPAAIRGVSSDGITWTLDGDADGVDDLRVGSILVASARATGRVVAIDERGGDRIVTLAPVRVQDIVRTGEIDLTSALDQGAVRSLHVTGQPAVLTEPSDEDLAGGRATFRAAHDLAPPQEGSVEIEAGDYKVTPAYSPGELSLDIQRDTHIKVGIHLAFEVADLSIDAGMSIADGAVGSSRFVLDGIKGLTVDLAAGTEDGDNDKIRVEVPVELSIPVPPSPATAGLPLEITIEFTASVETALTGKNSTLTALGSYGLDGSIGVRDGEFLTPSFTVRQSIIDSLAGITLGPSGVVVAVKMKVQAGLGIPEANAGPYGFVTTSLGVTNGSSLGASLARCKGATLDMEVGGGVSFEISSPLFDALEKLLPPGTEIPKEKGTKTNVLHRSQVVPDVPVCNGGE